MVYEQRASLNYVAGTLSTAAAISDTTLSADIFAGLPTDLTTTKYLPLVVHDPTAGLYEVVWVTTHTGVSTSVTVVRAREGSTARAWAAGSYVICSPTVRDTATTYTLAGLPTDAQTGMRAMVTDKGYVTERVAGGWGPSVGVALADHIGPNRSAANPTAQSAMLVRAGFVTGVTDANGQFAVTYRSAFPTGTIAAVVQAAGASPEAITFTGVTGESASGFTITVMRVTSVSPSYAAFPFQPGNTFKAMYIAVGY